MALKKKVVKEKKVIGEAGEKGGALSRPFWY
jgi:hypothetical protein